MKIFHDLDHTEELKNPVLTIGNYDGIHIGHRTIIRMVTDRARLTGGTSMLMTFDPHPLQILTPEKELPSITPLSRKIELIRETGIDLLIILPFTEEFGLLDPDDFVKDILVNRLKIRDLIIGYDFRYGREGRGSVALLREYGSRYGFSVEVVPPITIDDEKVGSNRIRVLVQEGAVAVARRLLGRPYAVVGQVISGMSRGREIGFPTINLKTEYNLIPRTGVYITEVEVKGEKHGAVTNIGFNPTFGNIERSIESFILDFEGSLYDCTVTLSFLKRLRDEVKFDSVKELKERIAKDVEEARIFFQDF